MISINELPVELQKLLAGGSWQEIFVGRSDNLVFTHGDYCLPNVLIDQPHGQINGFIDWGRAGVADRYHDLALAARSLTYNFGPGWEPLLWEAYGLEAVDNARLEFYQLLDEFF